jgi:hypothetical protein
VTSGTFRTSSEGMPDLCVGMGFIRLAGQAKQI